MNHVRVLAGCVGKNGLRTVCNSNQQCCDGMGCQEGAGGTCCGPNFYFMTQSYTEYCTAAQQCCSNTISALCCDLSQRCCTEGDSVSCCSDVHPAADTTTSLNDNWWLWVMFILMVGLLLFIVVMSCFEESAPGYTHARRLSDWYNERNRQQDEMLRLSQHRHQEPNPPLYQTIVPPTYQYQKPPTPREPPPKYEESPESGEPPSRSRPTDSDQQPNTSQAERDPIEGAVPPQAADGQPEYNKRGKVKKSRVSPLLQHIRSLEGAKLLKNGHNIFVRKSDKNLPATPDPNNYGSTDTVEESLVFELRTDSITTYEVQ